MMASRRGADASENRGHLAARTAEYAQDKMEQLLVLSFADDTTDTRVFPANPAGGTGIEPGGSAIRRRRSLAMSTIWTRTAIFW